MTVLLVLLAMLLFAILWIVFIPVHVRINTDRDLYEISQAGTVKLSFHPYGAPFVRLQALGISLNVSKRGTTPPPSHAKGGATRINRSPAAWRFLVKGIYRSLRLNRLVCAVDLDDVVLNAQLVPVLMLLEGGVVRLSTNFTNRCFLELEMEARLNRVIWVFIRFLIKK